MFWTPCDPWWSIYALNLTFFSSLYRPPTPPKMSPQNNSEKSPKGNQNVNITDHDLKFISHKISLFLRFPSNFHIFFFELSGFSNHGYRFLSLALINILDHSTYRNRANNGRGFNSKIIILALKLPHKKSLLA